MKLLWTGSDVLFATKFVKHSKRSKWPYMLAMRIFAKIADIFVEQHYIVSEHLRRELQPLNLKKPISLLVDPPLYTRKYTKRKHDMFRVLYYRAIGGNEKFNDWCYGRDIIKELKKRMPGIYIKEVNKGENMAFIYPYMDFMVRPNRHDGNPRMVMECEINDIPYYWSKTDPDIEEIIRQIKHEKSKEHSKI